MQEPNQVTTYDVVIVGAGPAGSSCALSLKGAGLSVALLDKSAFPRDKVCGDAIPGRAVKVLKSIDPVYETAFKQFPEKCLTKKTTLYYKGRQLTFSWSLQAYTCTRMAFDHFLLSLVQQHTDTHVLTNTQADSYTHTTNGIDIAVKNSNRVLHAKLLIGADGAQSVAAKQLAGKTLNRDHHIGSVRAYYSGVTGIDSDTTEIYFDRQFLPSYLWVFPLPGHTANVGFGMLSGEIARRKINIKKTFYEFIQRAPKLKEKLKDAAPVGSLDGFGLPLGSHIGHISGDHFMLAGDAASLIDPISGDGIGNAMLSGRLAALQAVKCSKSNEFVGDRMKQYDESLLTVIGKELKTHYRAQRVLAKMPFLLDVVFLAARVPALKRLIQKAL